MGEQMVCDVRGKVCEVREWEMVMVCDVRRKVCNVRGKVCAVRG